MPCDVHLDGEKVNFEGQVPKRVQDVLFFLEDFLKQQQKHLTKVFLDNKPLSFSDFETSVDSIKVLSCESRDITNVKVSEVLKNFEKNISAATCILVGDSEQIMQFAQNFVQELLNVLSLLKEECYLLSIIYEPLYLQWMQVFIQSLEDRNFGLTYDIILSSLVPLLEETQNQCL